MSGIGFSELIILALIGLIVLGPERLPRVANQLGGWLGQARRMTRVMKRQLEDEINIEEELGIKPPPASREPSTQPKPVIPRDDDDYSPAHEAGATGTGVSESEDNSIGDFDSDYHMYSDDDDLAVKSSDLDEAPVDADAGANAEETEEYSGEEKKS